MTKKIVKKSIEKAVKKINDERNEGNIKINIIDEEKDKEATKPVKKIDDNNNKELSIEDKLKSKAKPRSTADLKPKKVRIRVKCEHGKRPCLCVPCGGASTCEHKRVRAQCIDCGGKNVCKHKRLKADCRECNGSNYCQHGNFTKRCKECRGSMICQHNKERGICKECNPGGGGQICIHNIEKRGCKICRPDILCIHNKRKPNCDLCQGYSRCIHKKFKILCELCGGSQLCCHKKNKRRCLDCGNGEDLCTHGKYKILCNICDIIIHPEKWCELCKTVRVVKKSPYKPYCYMCYYVQNPDTKMRKYKLKEHYMVEELKDKYNDIDILFDKRVDGGCSLKRPDVRIECYTHSVIIECDENRHIGYSCENKRIMEIFQDLGERPIVFLRFNPDSYKDSETGQLISGCFSTKKNINNYPLKKEWKKRIAHLISRIDYYLENIPEKEVTVEHLFYD